MFFKTFLSVKKYFQASAIAAEFETEHAANEQEVQQTMEQEFLSRLLS